MVGVLREEIDDDPAEIERQRQNFKNWRIMLRQNRSSRWATA
jgi:hypothetical protein